MHTPSPAHTASLKHAIDLARTAILERGGALGPAEDLAAQTTALGLLAAVIQRNASDPGIPPVIAAAQALSDFAEACLASWTRSATGAEDLSRIPAARWNEPEILAIADAHSDLINVREAMCRAALDAQTNALRFALRQRLSFEEARAAAFSALAADWTALENTKGAA